MRFRVSKWAESFPYRRKKGGMAPVRREAIPYPSRSDYLRPRESYRLSFLFRLSPAMNQLGESLTPVPFYP